MFVCEYLCSRRELDITLFEGAKLRYVIVAGDDEEAGHHVAYCTACDALGGLDRVGSIRQFISDRAVAVSVAEVISASTQTSEQIKFR